MKKNIIIVILIVLLTGCKDTNNNSLNHPYFEQAEPNFVPEIFAPGIVSTPFHDVRITFSPDLKECFFYTVYQPNDSTYKWTTLYSKVEDEKWTFPEVAKFSGIYNDHAPCIHPNGKILIYQSDRPITEYDCSDKWSFWWMEKINGEWSEPKPMSKIINSKGNVFGPSIAANGNLYFTRELTDGSQVIMRSDYENNVYMEPVQLPKTINSVRSQFDAAIAPDESYIIVPVYGREDTIGSTDYYISFREDNDQWSELINLGREINTANVESGPYISPDGHFFFFQSYGFKSDSTISNKPVKYSDMIKMLNSSDIYWISTQFFNKFKK